MVLIALAATASFVLALTAAGQELNPEPQVASVDWADRPDDVEELADDARAVVQAEVTEIEDGPDLLDPADSDDPDEGIPTQRIAMSTLSVLEGNLPAQFLVFKTGSADLHLAGDPFYEVGERYVLFLEPRDGEPGTYVPSAPDGRLVLDSQGETEGFIGGPVTSELEGKTPEEIGAEVEESG